MISRAQKLRQTLTSSPLSTIIKARSFFHVPLPEDINAIVSKVPIGSAVDRIVQTLETDEKCKNVKLTHQLFDELLKRFGQDWKSAMGVFRWAQSRPGYKHTPEAYDQIIDILGKTREFESMNSLLGEMRTEKIATLETIAKAMRRFAGGHKWQEAVRLFDELGSYGLEKDTESMNLLLDTLCKSHRVNDARAIYQDLKPHISPNANTFTIFIHGWCIVGRIEEAHLTIQEMKGHGFVPCVVSYSIIVEFYSRLGNFGEACRVLGEMRDAGCPPNIVTHTIVVSCLAKLKMFDDALKIAERAKSDECEPDILFYNSLIFVLGGLGKVEEAIQVFKSEMPNKNIVPNTSTYNTLIAVCCRCSNEKMALSLLREMENSGACKPDCLTYYPIFKLCFRMRKVDNLLKRLLDDMVKKHHIGLDLSAYSLLIHGLCQSDKCEWAYDLLSEMINQGINPRYKTCRVLLTESRRKRLSHIEGYVEAYIKTM